MVAVSSILSGAKRVIKVLPDLVLGNGAEVAGQAIKTTIKNKGSIFEAAKAGVKATEGLSVAANGAKIGFFTRITSNLGLLKSMPVEAFKAAKVAGKGVFGQAWAGTKGFFKGLGKNMPFIAAAMELVFQLPNFITATKEKGIGQGIKELGKAAGRLSIGGICAAIGSAFCPPIGTMVGWVVGDWIGSKIVGKSYTEKKAEAEYEAQLAAEQAALQAQQAGYQVYTDPQTGEQFVYQPTEAVQPSFQGGDPYPNSNGATNPFDAVLSNNPMTNPFSNGSAYSNDVFAQNIDFNKLAQELMNNMYAPQQQMQPQTQPQISTLIP